MSLTDAQIVAADKYSHDGEFVEPLVRCDSCSRLIFVKELTRRGMCQCGNTRVRNVKSLKKKELKLVSKWADEGKLDKVWVDLWVPVE